MTPPLKWHGGKHYLAPKIIELMPPHIHYVEPYFGGGSVLLAKDPEGVSEVVNDLNGQLMTFWRVLQDNDHFATFKRHVEAVPFSEQEWCDARDDAGTYYRNQDPALQAARFFVHCRQSMSGRMKCFSPLTKKRTRRGMNEQASAWMSCVEGLEAVHKRMMRVAIVGPTDALEVIRQQDCPDTLFYLDPPYLHETRNGHSPADYAHEMTDDDHDALLETVSSVEGKVILSGYQSNLYTKRLASWKLYTFDLPNNAAHGKEKRRMTECVWANF